jgi:hypothetical protein
MRCVLLRHEQPADRQPTRAAGSGAGANRPQAYLDALARGDGKAACRLLSPAVISDTGDYPTRAACVRELSDARDLGRFPIVKGRDAILYVGRRVGRRPAWVRHGLRQPSGPALRQPLVARGVVTPPGCRVIANGGLTWRV